MPFLPVLLVALLSFFPLSSVAKGEQGVVESLYCAPLVVLPPSPPLPPHLPPVGRLWTVAWQGETQGYILSSTPSSMDPKRRLLAQGLISNASVNHSGWWQLAIRTDIDLDDHKDEGAEYKEKGDLGRSHDKTIGLRHQNRDDDNNNNGKDDGKDDNEHAAWILRRWYAAGLLEGYVTAPLMAEYALNAKHSLFGAHHYPSDGLLDFFEENRAYVRSQINFYYGRYHEQQQQQQQQHTEGELEEETNDKTVKRNYWLGAAAVLAQFQGLVAGYHATATHAQHAPLSALELYLLNAYGDIFDLSALFPPQRGAPPSRLGRWLGGREGGRKAGDEEMEEEKEDRGTAVWESRDNDRCSVLIKGTKGKEGPDVLIGHTTYDYYIVAWPRIVKETVLPSGLGWTRSLYSSSPGQLASLDDLYVLQGGGGGGGRGGGERRRERRTDRQGGRAELEKQMVITETTISMKDIRTDALLPLLKPQALLYWMRVAIANSWAQNGEQWTEIFSEENSGTYNCEWMVLDVTQRSFHVLDQAPDKVKITDHTPTLFSPSTSPFSNYFASYNIPSDKEIYDYLGFGLKDPHKIKYLLEKHGESPRALMLGEGQREVSSLGEMKYLIQYNDYEHDPRSMGHAYLAVAGRGDLEAANTEVMLAKDLEDATENDPLFSSSSSSSSQSPLYSISPSPVFAPLEGAMDAKVVSVREAFSSPDGHLSLHARVGPTHDQQIPFCWAGHEQEDGETTDKGTRPACFRFAWERLSPGKVLAEEIQRQYGRRSLLLRGGKV